MYSRSLGVAGKLALGLCFVVNCLVQAASNGGTIAGIVSDQTGAPMANVSVSVRDVNTGAQRTAFTNQSGYYAFPVLDIGSYELAVHQPGFRPYCRTGLHINASAFAQADISLEIGTRQESISVTDTALQVEHSETERGETISGRTVNATPLNGRSLTDLLALQPGVVPISSQQPNAVNMG